MRPWTAAALLILAATTPSLARADTLVDNVDGFTFTAEGRIQRFNGLLIGDDGRVEQLLQRSDKRPARADFRLDGKGRVLMPGLVDAHVDVMALGLALLGPSSDKARPRPEDRDGALAKAQQYLLERGVTTATDMGTSIEAWQTYRRAGDLGRLSLRIVGFAASVDDMVLIGGPGPTPWLYDDRLRLNGLRISFAPPPPAPIARRTLTVAQAQAEQAAHNRQAPIQLKNLLSRAAIDGFQAAVVIQDAGSLAPVLDAMAEMQQTYKGDRRWRIDMPLAPEAAALPRIVQQGISVSLIAPPGGPAPAIPAFAGPGAPSLHYSIGSGTRQGGFEPFASLANTLARETALFAMSADAARAAQAEGRFGRLAVGQRADFLLVDRDPLLAAPSELRSFRVLQTWIGGKMAWQAKEEAPSAPR